MRIITNERLIKRNATIGRFASLLGLALLAVAVFISFQQQERIVFGMIAMLSGFAFSQLGIYFGNRFGRRPRPDELLNDALKGLGDNYTIYHYTSPVAHLLIGPAGIWSMIPLQQTGKIVYEKNRWKQKGGNFGQKYLRFFAQEGLGRPDQEIASDIEAINRFIKKNIQDEGIVSSLPAAQAALVFTNERAEIAVDGAPAPTLTAKKLKEFIRKVSKEKLLTQTEALAIQQVIEN